MKHKLMLSGPQLLEKYKNQPNSLLLNVLSLVLLSEVILELFFFWTNSSFPCILSAISSENSFTILCLR